MSLLVWKKHFLAIFFSCIKTFIFAELVSTARAQIVPRLKQLRLKLTAQQATLLVDEY